MRLSYSLIAVLSSLFFSGSAFALTIDATDTTPDLADAGAGWKLVAFGNQTSQKEINGVIDSLVTMPELYKQDVDGPESGSLAGSYTTNFSNTATDPSDATVTYNGGDIFDPNSPIHALVKDGNNKPAWYLFELINWDGMDTLDFVNFWAGKGAISHVAIYGERGDGGLPEPRSMVVWSTLLLAGLVVSSVRRRRTSS